MDTKSQSLCLWGGYSFLVVYLIGFVVVAHFIPPPSPSLNPAEIAGYFVDHRVRILLGMLICVIATPLVVLWSVAVFVQMRRIESGSGVLSYIQLMNGALGAPFFMIPPMLWATLAYRVDQDGLMVRAINDFAWIAWIISWPLFFFQQVSIGLCGLKDRSEVPVFPRWICFLSFWAATSMVPAGAVIFVKSGPFAWTGLFGLYLPLCLYVAWYSSVTVALAKAINRDKREAPNKISNSLYGESLLARR